MSEQKMREALELIAFAEPRVWPVAQRHTFRQYAQRLAREALAATAEPSGNSGEFAAPAGEQVGLTDDEVKEHFHHGSRTSKMSGPMNARDLAGIRQVIAAHEAKRGGAA